MKKVYKVLAAGIGLGLLITILSIAFKWEEDKVLYYYWRIGFVILLIILIVNTCYYFYKVKQIKKLMKLFEEEKYQSFVDQMEKLIAKTKVKTIKNIMKLNLGAGYIELKDPKKTLEIYKTLDPKKLSSKELKLVYWLNTMVSYFRLEDYKNFKIAYKDNGEILKAFENNKNYSNSIQEVYILKAILDEDLDQAREKLEELKNKSTKAKSKDDYENLEKLINEKQERKTNEL